jgi:hypothetical protein
VLLTTDVASRGLHLRALRHVVNLDMCALPPPPPPSRTQLSTRMRTRAAMTITQSPVLLNRQRCGASGVLSPALRGVSHCRHDFFTKTTEPAPARSTPDARAQGGR